MTRMEFLKVFPTMAKQKRGKNKLQGPELGEFSVRVRTIETSMTRLWRESDRRWKGKTEQGQITQILIRYGMGWNFFFSVNKQTNNNSKKKNYWIFYKDMWLKLFFSKLTLLIEKWLWNQQEVNRKKVLS